MAACACAREHQRAVTSSTTVSANRERRCRRRLEMPMLTGLDTAGCSIDASTFGSRCTAGAGPRYLVGRRANRHPTSRVADAAALCHLSSWTALVNPPNSQISLLPTTSTQYDAHNKKETRLYLTGEGRGNATLAMWPCAATKLLEVIYRQTIMALSFHNHNPVHSHSSPPEATVGLHLDLCTGGEQQLSGKEDVGKDEAEAVKAR